MSNIPYVSINYLSSYLTQNNLVLKHETHDKTEENRYQKNIEYLLITAGSGSIEINHKFYNVKRGSLIQILPYQMYRIVLVEHNQLSLYRLTFSIGHLVLTASQQSAYFNSIESLTSDKPVLNLRARSIDFVEFGLKNAYQDDLNTRQNYQMTVIPLITHIFFKDGYTESDYEVCRTLSGHVLDYIQEHVTVPLRIEQCALSLGIKEKELRQLIRKSYGKSYSAFYIQIQIYQCLSLIQYEKLSIGMIINYCGFRNVGEFERKFYQQLHIQYADFKWNNIFKQENSGYQAFDIIGYLYGNCHDIQCVKKVQEYTGITSDKLNEIVESILGISIETFIRLSKDQVHLNYNNVLNQ